MRLAVALLLQGALGGAFLVVLALVLIAAVVVIAAVSGGTLGGGDRGQEAAPIIPPGTILAASGLGLAALGGFYASAGLNFVGIIAGAIAYYRGARVLGVAATVLSFVTIFVGYYLGSGASQFNL